MRTRNRNVEVRSSNLDDPDYAAFAWARYWRVMRWMGAATLGTVIVVLAVLYFTGDPLPLQFYIATALGVLLTVMLAAGLMGLVFLSSGTGHDEAIDDLIAHDVEEEDIGGDRLP